MRAITDVGIAAIVVIANTATFPFFAPIVPCATIVIIAKHVAIVIIVTRAIIVIFVKDVLVATIYGVVSIATILKWYNNPII